MASDFLRQYAVGGATRPDSFSGLSPDFAGSLASMFGEAPPEIQNTLRISSGFRSPQRQAELWQGALAKYGSEEAARKWVAPPGRSNHNHGQAVDLKYLDPSALDWVRQNASKYGLALPLSNENWHIEPIGARGGQGGGMQPGTAVPMMAQAGAPQPTTPGFQMDAAPVAPPVISPLAGMFATQQADAEQKKQQEAAQAAEVQRRAALFGGPSPFG